MLTLARLAVATLILSVTLGFSDGASSDRPVARAIVGVVIAIFAASIGYAWMLSRGQDLRTLAVVQIALDLAAWTAIVCLTGGPASPMSFFFALTTLTAAMTLGAEAARRTAIVGVGIYGAVAIAMTADVLPMLPEQLKRTPLTHGELAYQIVINVVAMLLVAALGGSLANRISRAGAALARMEASRAALAALYEDVLRSIPVGLLTCTEAGTIEGANPVAARLFSVPVETLLGTPVTRWLPFLPPDVFATESDPLAGDATLQRPDGSLHVAYRTAPLFDREGKVHGGLVIIEDRSNIEAMRDAMQRAERLAALGRLAAGLAHEIRNPLGAISGCVELVREAAGLSAEDRQLLATVVQETERLNALVTDMLTFAKPRPPELVPTDLVALAREVVTLANASSPRARVLLVANNVHELMAPVDPSQIRQVLWNLVRNACQVSPEGEVVEVAVRRRDDAAEIAVADRGPGVPPEQRDKLFDVFYSHSTRGTGLGLAIVKQIAEAHGARVDLRTRDGGGSEFALVLPLPPAQPATAQH
uniref:histidine kinase n=1 Tax=uncultured delta proteobacterium TaxID=34034 RepID=H5SJE3_9DELT|nr:multi-sensor signal transduction histidine kinase [uncultured delta proteobacterium]